MSFRFRSTLRVAALATLAISTLFTACTTDPESDSLGVAPGIVYADTAHIASSYVVTCPENLSYVAYWGLRYVNANGDTISGRWLGVSVSSTSMTASTWSVGTNLASDEAESPANKASVLLFGVAGSQASSSARIRVTPFAGGDSVRIEGKDILLQNGRLLNFNLVNAVACET
jgi:hypothetical protein